MPNPKEKQSILGYLTDFSENDMHTIRKWLLGGASLGTGAALLTSYANYVNSLKKKNTEDDDDTLYVYKKASAASADDDDSYLATPLAISGGVLATLGSYALVKKLYTKFKLREAQRELDEAQHAFINASGYEERTGKPLKNRPTKNEALDKSASAQGRGITSTEAILSTPVLVPLLSMLGAGVVTYKMLDKNFPTQIKKVKGPRRIEVIEKPEEDQEEYEKKASADGGMFCDAVEYLMRMALLTKSASSDLSNLVAAAATGELDAFEKTASVIGFVNALDTVKGASSRTFSPLAEHLAICTLAKKASINAQVGVLAAAELADTQTHSFLQAAALEEDQQEALYKSACCMGRAIRMELSHDLGIRMPEHIVKQAMTLDELSDIGTGNLMGKLLRNMAIRDAISSDEEDNKDMTDTNDNSDNTSDKKVSAPSDAKEVSAGETSDATDTSGEETGIQDPDSPSRRKTKDKVKFISNTKSRRGFLSKIDADVIDKILTP